MLYKPARVTPVGQTAVLNSAAFVNGGDSAPRSRPSLAQAFEQNSDHARFIVDINHLKSKGSACDDPDAGDGQGNCNIVRTNAATALMAWLASNPTGINDPDILMIGDYNSYAKEDPIAVIEGAGFTNLIAAHLGPDAYSYVFDGQWGYLDHALGSAAIVSQVTGVGDYHINSDEPSVLDYNDDFKSAGQIASLYNADQFRVSDHDPVLVGLDLNGPPTVDAGGPYTVAEGSSVAVSATGSDPENDTRAYAWDLDNNGSFETPGQSATFSAATLSAPGTYTIKVQVTDQAGNTATDTATVNVIYNFSGFFQPVDNPPTVNIVNAGRAIPVKFSLDGDQGLDIFAAGYPVSQSITCGTNPGDEIETTVTDTSSGLHYDPATDTYTYVWKTQNGWAGACRQLIVKLNDGTVHTALFQFR
jgi:hypothetical protein